MKRYAAAFLIALTIGTGTAMATPTQVQATPNVGGRSRVIRSHGPCSGRMAVIRHDQPQSLNIRREKRMTRCAFSRWSGDVARAFCTINRESSWYTWAYNSSSGASGLLQHLARYWPGRARKYLRRSWFPRMRSGWVPSPFNARANILVSARIVAASGWGDWAGGCV